MSTERDHPFSDELLISYAAGELVPAMRIYIEQHLSICDECSRTVALFRQVEQVLRTDDSIAPSNEALVRARAVFTPHPVAEDTSWSKRLSNWLMPPRGLLALSVPSALVAALFILISGWLLTPTISNALPGDTFYPVKVTVESVQLAVAIDDASQVQTQLAIADSRVKEMNALAAQQRFTEIPILAADYETRVQSATSGLSRVAAQNPSVHATLAPKVEQNLKQDTNTLATLQDTSPVSVKPQIAQAVSVSAEAQSAVQAQILNPVAPSATPTSTSTPSSTYTASATPSFTSTNTPSATPSQTATATSTPTVAPTSTLTPTPTSSSTPTNTATSTATLTYTPTNTPLPTDTPTAVPSSPANTPVPATMTPLPISIAPGSTAVPFDTPTETPAPISTATSLPTATSTPIPTRVRRATATPKVTKTPPPTMASESMTTFPVEAFTPTPTPLESPTVQLLLASVQERGDPPRGTSNGGGQPNSSATGTRCDQTSLSCSVSFSALVPYTIMLVVSAGLIRWMTGLADLSVQVSGRGID